MYKYLYLTLLVFCLGCKNRTEKISNFSAINNILNSSKTIDQKYYELKKSGLYPSSELTNSEIQEIGTHFIGNGLSFRLELDNNDKINLKISGDVYPRLEKVFFDNYELEVSTYIEFPNEKLLSIYYYSPLEIFDEGANFSISHLLTNDFLRQGDEIILDKSFLKHTPTKIKITIGLNATNKVGELLKTILIDGTYTDLWSKLVDEQNQYTYSQPDREEPVEYRTNTTTNKTEPLTDLEKNAEEKFLDYLPTILKSKGDGVVLNSHAITSGDFTNDGIDDVLIIFNCAAKDWGNTVSNPEVAFYETINGSPTVVAGFMPNYNFGIDKIENGLIYISKYSYGEDDPRCCPSIVENKILQYKNKLINELN